MSQGKPTYKIDELLQACESGLARVFVINEAMNTARKDFGLATQIEVCKFIASGGLESPRFVRTAIWRKNQLPEVQIMVDSYDFFSGIDFGYMAFFFQPATEKWNIKSFKKNDKPDPRNLVMAGPLAEIKKKLKLLGGRNE